MTTKEGVDPLFTKAALDQLTPLYLAGQDPRQPLLSPAVYADLAGLPPLLVQAGSNEILLDDSTRLATRAAAAGVDVILDVTADVPHVFQLYEGNLDEADAALDRAARFIRDRLAARFGGPLSRRSRAAASSRGWMAARSGPVPATVTRPICGARCRSRASWASGSGPSPPLRTSVTGTGS